MLNKTSRFLLLSLLTLILASPLVAAELKTDQAKLSYSLGIILGQQIQSDVKQLDISAFSQAIEDIYAQREPRLSEEQMQQAMNQFQEQVLAEAQAKQEEIAKANLAKGEEFLAKNAKASGVKTTKSGLQYKVVKQGKGNKPLAEDKVRVHYEGKLINDEVFDSSYQRGEPVVFQANQVIAGWKEGLQLMQEGAEFMFYIPADLAYGPAGAGGAIGPNETLIFKVELLQVNPQD